MTISENPAALSREEKERLLADNRAKVEADLWEARLEFASRPRVVDMQLSNFCNMSCTMCYDGVNPPLQKMPEEEVRRFAAEVFPTASVLVPFSGSEPLIVTWDLTRELAERYGIEIDLITNVQYLDEAKFAEIEPLVSTVTFSIDSHIPDVYERIRLKSKPDKVFRNLPIAAKLCREHGIEPQANIVFLTENAPYMDETVAYLADAGVATIRLLQYEQLPDLPPERRFSDAMQHFSPEWIEWMKGRIRDVAKEKKVRVIFDFFEKKELADHLPKDLKWRDDPKPPPMIERLMTFFPGYCWQSLDRIKLMANGNAYPCCKGDGDELRLGNVFEQGFDAVWNGPEAQDLRRGMLTDDLPRLCRDCSFHTAWIPEEQEHMPFHDWARDEGGVGLPSEASGALEVVEPAHMLRTEDAPLIRWKKPAGKVDRYVLAFGVGGEFHPDNRTWTIPGDAEEFRVPAGDWAALRSNLGWWWSLWAVDDGAGTASLSSARCLIRHDPIPRVAESNLYWADEAAQ